MQILVKLSRKILPIVLIYSLSPKWRKKPFVAKQIQKRAYELCDFLGHSHSVVIMEPGNTFSYK